MKKLIPAVSAAMLFVSSVCAQDLHFTQYFASPLTLNPAMAGLVEGDFRAAMNLREQWSTVSAHPSITGTLSYDMGVLKGKLPQGDAIGIGVMGLYDKEGSGGLTNKTVGLSLAYHKAFGRHKLQHISLGLQGNFVQKEIHFDALTFGSPGSVFVSGGTPSFSSARLNYPDLNMGAMYSGRVSARTTAYLGYSYYHLTQPVETFFGNNDHQIHARHTGYMGGTFDIKSNLLLHANVLYQKQAEAQDITLGAAISASRKNTIFYMGGWYRYRDAISPYFAIEWSKMRIGLSYDVNVSSFTPATKSMGAIELSALFFGNINKRESNPNYNWACPKIF